jgi:hypothetical protein
MRQSCRVIPTPASTPRAPTGLPGVSKSNRSELQYATTAVSLPTIPVQISQSSPRGKRIPAQGATLGIQKRHHHRVLKERRISWNSKGPFDGSWSHAKTQRRKILLWKPVRDSVDCIFAPWRLERSGRDHRIAIPTPASTPRAPTGLPGVSKSNRSELLYATATISFLIFRRRREPACPRGFSYSIKYQPFRIKRHRRFAMKKPLCHCAFVRTKNSAPHTLQVNRSHRGGWARLRRKSVVRNGCEF